MLSIQQDKDFSCILQQLFPEIANGEPFANLLPIFYPYHLLVKNAIISVKKTVVNFRNITFSIPVIFLVLWVGTENIHSGGEKNSTDCFRTDSQKN